MMKKQIAVDVTPLSRDQRGMGHFASGFLQAWAEIRPADVDLSLVTASDAGVVPKELLHSFPLMRVADLLNEWTLWSPFNLPSFKTSAPTILTIHDLTPFAFPLGEAKLRQKYTQAISAAIHVIASSQYTQTEIKKYLNLPDSKISTAYLGFDPNLDPGNERIDYPSKYIFAIGTSEPRKNFDGLLRAFAKLKRRGIPHRLVILGDNPTWPSSFGPWIIRKKNPLQGLASSLKIDSAVNLLGAVEKRSTVLSWYRHASLVAVPSFYEGFGYPVLEAFAAEIPLACSRAASLTEVAGQGAFYFDPHDIDEMVEAILEALSNTYEVEKKKKIGKEQLARFSWKNCIERYAEIFRTVIP